MLSRELPFDDSNVDLIIKKTKECKINLIGPFWDNISTKGINLYII